MTKKEAILISIIGVTAFLAVLLWGTRGCIAFVLLALITLFSKRKTMNPEEKLFFYKTSMISSIFTFAFLFVLFYLQDKSFTILSLISVKEIWIFLALAFILIVQGLVIAVRNNSK